MEKDDFTMYSKPYENNGKWFVDITTIDGEILKTEEFPSEIKAKTWIDEIIKNYKKETSKNQKNKAKDSIRNSLKDFINDEDENDLLNAIKDEKNNLPIDNGNELPAFNRIPQFDFAEEKKKGYRKARGLMDSMLKLYLSQELIDRQEYIRAKTKFDRMTMSQLFTQMKISEHAINVMISAIDRGEIHPRMFEVLGGLQSKILDIMKHQTLHMMAAEENLKKLKHDIDIYGKKDVTSEDAEIIEDNQNLTRGTRDMMKQLQSKIASNKGEIVEENEEENEEEIENDIENKSKEDI